MMIKLCRRRKSTAQAIAVANGKITVTLKSEKTQPGKGSGLVRGSVARGVVRETESNEGEIGVTLAIEIQERIAKITEIEGTKSGSGKGPGAEAEIDVEHEKVRPKEHRVIHLRI